MPQIINHKSDMFLPTMMGPIVIKKGVSYKATDKEYQILCAIYKDCQRVPMIDKPGRTQPVVIHELEGTAKKGKCSKGARR